MSKAIDGFERTLWVSTGFCSETSVGSDTSACAAGHVRQGLGAEVGACEAEAMALVENADGVPWAVAMAMCEVQQGHWEVGRWVLEDRGVGGANVSWGWQNI